ncbi:restriction endonuclease subunit S [Rhodoferax sp.]|uniref:restriction endonuclease subunit S n=1 Tax=Rhodoferax sp. TaxID=50421 RepID=UPI002633B001|nr:restriction endonuclease subunit S [Rhodoferax sp.]MDD5480411.1 restriction endonuclease subunit S [Rhodoferax sp.]
MKMVELGYLADVIMGQSPPGDSYNTTGIGLPFFQGKTEFGDVSPIAVKWCSQPTKLAKAGDILISVRAPVGPTNIADQNCCIGRGLAAIRPKIEYADRDFVWFYLQFAEKSLIQKGQGSTFQAINGDDLRKLEILAITLDQQRQTAARLKAQLAEVAMAREAVVKQLREASVLKSRALEALFSGIENRKPIGSVARLQSGFAFKSDSFKKSGVRLLRNANILPGKVYWDDSVFLDEAVSRQYPSYELHAGDVLISLDRPIISSGIKVARVGTDDLPALLVQRVGRFLIDREAVDADYLFAYLQTDLFISKISGHEQSVGVPHISPSQVESVEIPLPAIAIQRELSKKLNEVTDAWRDATTAIQAQRDDLALLPQKILTQAFAPQKAHHD